MYRSKMAKKCFAGVAGMLLTATVLFGGCTDGQAGSAAQVLSSARMAILLPIITLLVELRRLLYPCLMVVPCLASW